MGDPDEGCFLDDARMEPGQGRVTLVVRERGARLGDQRVELVIAEIAPVVRDRREVPVETKRTMAKKGSMAA